MAIVGAAVLWWLYPRAESVNDGRTEITVWFNGPIEGRQLAVANAFERRFPQYRVILGSSATRTGLEGEGNPQRLMCGIAGGVPPEVVEYDRFAVCQWSARGAFLDLNSLIEKDRIAGEEALYPIDVNDFYPQTWNECTYRGGQYGIPNYMDDRALYYNADLLIAAGLIDEQRNPVPPRTWEQVCFKRVDVNDARIDHIDERSARITSTSAAFLSAGVRQGDTVSHISRSGVVKRCIVERVDSEQAIVVRSPYPSATLALPQGDGRHVKIFDQDGYALRLSKWDDNGQLEVVGFEPHHGNGWLYMYSWMNGGFFLSEDGLTCTLDDPRVVAALQWTTDVYDALGGLQDVNAFKKSFQAGALDPFFNGQIAMFINGDWFLREISRYARYMNFGVAVPPIPKTQLETNPDATLTWVAGFAYCIPATCPPDKLDAAWTFVKFLSSVEGAMVMNEHDAQRERGQGRLYMPRLMARKSINAEQWARYVDTPDIPQRLRDALQLHIDLLPRGRFRLVTPVGKKLWDAQATSQDLAWNHKYTPAEALRLQAVQVQQAIDDFYNPTSGATLRWAPWIGIYITALALLGVGLYLRHAGRHRHIPGYMRKDWVAGVMFALPWIIGFVVLSGGPMVFSLIMSFTRYDVLSPPVVVGLKNYRDLFDAESDPLFYKSLWNTVYMTLSVPLGMIVGLAIAMLLNAKVRGMSIYRTLFFLPAIMPVVAASILWIWVFNPQNGLMNWMLQLTGIESLIAYLDIGLKTPIRWLSSEQTSKPALIIMMLWGAGASMIIWLAGLQDIPKHLYEAAELDGAGPIRRFLSVTLPMLSPYILFNLIMGMIGTFQIFTQAYIMTPNGSPAHSTYFYVYKLFDECFSYFRLGYGAAMAWVLFVIVIVLTIINMIPSRRWVYYAGD